MLNIEIEHKNEKKYIYTNIILILKYIIVLYLFS